MGWEIRTWLYIARILGGILKYGLGGRGVSINVYTAASPLFIDKAFSSTVGVNLAEKKNTIVI